MARTGKAPELRSLGSRWEPTPRGVKVPSLPDPSVQAPRWAVDRNARVGDSRAVLQAPREPASSGWVQIPLWSTSQPWGRGRARQQGWPRSPWAAGARPSATGRRREAEAAPGCWVGVACKHTLGYRLVPPCPWGTASRTPCSYRNPPDAQALGCSSAVFAQSLMAQTSGVKCPSSRAGAV